MSSEEAAATTRHLAGCPACRGYFQQLSALCAGHAEAARRLPVASVASRIAAPSSPKAPPEAAGSKLITYRLALNRSPEEFERLLAREAARPSAGPGTAFRPGWARLDPSGK